MLANHFQYVRKGFFIIFLSLGICFNVFGENVITHENTYATQNTASNSEQISNENYTKYLFNLSMPQVRQDDFLLLKRNTSYSVSPQPSPSLLSKQQSIINSLVATYSFSKLIGTGDIVLNGLTPTFLFYAPLPELWQVNGVQLHLVFNHSPILSKISTLTVLLNDKPIDTLNLTPENSEQAFWDVTIPPNFIKGKDLPIKLSAFMEITTDPCADIENSGNWTRISETSTIAYSYNQLYLRADLASFPFPFIRQHSLDPDSALLITPQNPSLDELMPAFNLARVLGIKSTWRGLDLYFSGTEKFNELDKTHNNIIIIGTTQKLPILKQLAPLLPLTFDDKTGEIAMRSGEKISPNAGIIMLAVSPWNPTRGLMVITGPNEQAINNAVATLQDPTFPRLVRNNFAVITKTPNIQPIHKINWNSTTLAQLGYPDDLTVYGEGQNIIHYNIDLPTRIVPQALKFDLEFSHSPFLDPDHSYLMLSANGSPVGGIILTPSTANIGHWQVTIPQRALVPGRNSIDFLFDLDMRRRECNRRNPSRAWGAIFSETKVSAEFLSEKPPLRLTQFPSPFDADSLVVIPPQLNTDEQTKIAELLIMFGKIVGPSSENLQLIKANDVSRDQLTRHNVILIGQPTDNEWIAYALARAPVSFKNNVFKFNYEGLKFSVINDKPLGLVQITNSPWNSDMTSLIITGSNQNAVDWALNLLIKDKVRSTLEGEIATVDANQNVVPIDLNPFNENKRSVSYSHYIPLFGILLILIAITIILAMRHLKPDHSKPK